MGSIVSVNKESNSDEVYPSEAVTMQAKLRQAALAAQPDLVKGLSRPEAYGQSEPVMDWYPAGISPWYLDHHGVIVRREVSSDTLDKSWMDHLTLTKGDLHRCAVLIQKLVRGHQARSALRRQQQSARKIQRTFRQWKKSGVTCVSSLPALHNSSTQSVHNDRTLSADTWSRQHQSELDIWQSIGKSTEASSEKDEFEFEWQETEWNQQTSLCNTTDSIVSSEETRYNVCNENTTSEDAHTVTSEHTVTLDRNTLTSEDGHQTVYNDMETNRAMYPPVGQHNTSQQQLGIDTVKNIHPRSTNNAPLRQPPSYPVSTRLQMQFPSALSTPPTRTGHSKTGFRFNTGNTRVHQRGPVSDVLGSDLSVHADKRDTNAVRKERREDMYPAMTPGPTLKQSQHNKSLSKGSLDLMCNTADGSCGVKSMTLQNASTRWVKPLKEKRRSREKIIPVIHKTSSAKPRGQTSSPEKVMHPPLATEPIAEEAPVVEQQPERQLHKFTTKESLVCEVKTESDSSICCPIKSVDTMIDIFSQGLDKSIHVNHTLSEETSSEETAGGLQITAELVHTVHSVLNRQLTSMYMTDSDYSNGSILIKPSDVESLLRAAEFRNDIVGKLKHLTTSIRLDYYQLMDDIEQTQFYAAQQVETGLANYEPQTLVLISSTIPKCERLRDAVKTGVLVHVYDFTCEAQDIVNSVRALLDAVRPGAKAKHVAIVCKGGPGHFYLVKKMPVTPAKLRNNQSMLQFWRNLGGLMSKLLPGQSVIHLMESNMAGNKQGEKLLVDLESALYAHQVKVRSPLELAASGREMINTYFDPIKHKLWKTTRYTKLQLY